jgi:hypothetical protein
MSGWPFERLDERRRRERPEVARERFLLLRRQLLVAQENDAVLGERAPQRGFRVGVERPRSIDAGDLGAARTAQQLDLKIAHYSVPAQKRPGHEQAVRILDVIAEWRARSESETGIEPLRGLELLHRPRSPGSAARTRGALLRR